MKQFCITLSLFLLIFHTAFSQETENADEPEKPKRLSGSKIRVIIAQDTLTVGSPFTLTILVDYPEPEDVSVIAPPFPETISMEKYLRAPRVTGNPTPAEIEKAKQQGQNLIHTSVEFTLIPRAAGRIELSSFSVITPEGAAETGAIILNTQYQERGQVIQSVRLSWEGAPAQITAGDRVTFVLRTNPPAPVSALSLTGSLPHSFFMPEVPRGVILSQVRISQEEKESGVALKLTLIPLSEGNFNLPSRNLQYDNIRFAVPALNIRITAAAR